VEYDIMKALVPILLNKRRSMLLLLSTRVIYLVR
jgi:hypothetical protein